MANETNTSLIKQAVVTALSNKRQDTSHTKTRGNVSGGGKKPWRQKGTGRARAGSSRSPIWVGGGITFGPLKNRSHKAELPKKMATKAVQELLSLIKNNHKLLIVDSLTIKEPKTKAALALLKTHNLTGKVLLITNNLNAELVLATGNLPNVRTVTNSELSILDLANDATVVMEKAVATARDLATEPKPAKKTTKETK